MMDSTVSIVIVNWNTIDLLDQCLKSVYQETDKGLIEVIVVDNGSSDDSCQMVKNKYPDVILIENEENRGFAAANNQGFDIARGEYVLMLNSDTIILDRAIEKVLDYAEKNRDAAVVGCKLLHTDMSFQNSCFRYPGILSIVLSATYLSQIFKKSVIFNQDRYGNCEWSAERDVDVVMGSFLFIDRKVLEEVGHLDKDYFMFGEEADLCYRVKKAGYKIRYYPHTEIIHIWAGSQKETNLSAWAYGAVIRGQLLFIAKNKSMFEAYICNFIIMVFLLPRVILWGLHDAFCAIRKKASRSSQFSKGGIVLFLLRVLFRPGTLYSKWHVRK